MKKSIYFLAILGALFLVSCAGKNGDDSGEGIEESTMESAEKSIVGTWQLTDMDMGTELTSEQEAQFEQMLEKMKESVYYTFNADGTITYGGWSADGAMSDGTYKLDGGTVEINTNGITENLRVKIDGDQLTISGEMGGTTNTMVLQRK